MNKISPLTKLSWLSALLIAASLSGCGGASSPVTPAGGAAAAAVPAATSVVLTGTPPTSVTAGQNYLFQPTLAQGAGTVTFQIQGKPSWATFDTDTGVLTGTPAAANEGTSASITITGTNGSSSSSIGPFTILVNAPAPTPATTGSATLSWNVPTENTDGTPITDLAGYHIYYGTSAGALTTTVTIANPAETSYVVGGLAPGTYYFAIVAYNSAGIDSPQSNTASKTI
jgi:Putative Ig domain